MIASRRKGFTLIELLIVVTIVGILTIVTAPTGRRIMVNNAVRSAKQEIAATLAVARASAIHNGRPTRFVKSGNVVHVRLEVGSQYDTVGVPLNMYEHRVTVVMSPDTIRFDPRGFATGMAGEVFRRALSSAVERRARWRARAGQSGSTSFSRLRTFSARSKAAMCS